MESNIKNNIIRVLNVFENDSQSPDTDYFTVYKYFDGPEKTKQTTLGRGYTENGSLWTVFQYYKDLGGKNAEKLLSYRSEKGRQTLPNNKEFLNLIISSAKNDQSFRDAEDRTFDDIYWNKGLNYFNEGKFSLNLSLAVIQDSILHSGGILGFLTNRFSEKKPVDGGDEKEWIIQYVRVRREWLQSKGGILANTVYRMDFFLKQFKSNNWDFASPIIANGAKIC